MSPISSDHWTCHAAWVSPSPKPYVPDECQPTYSTLICDWAGCPLRGEVNDPATECFLAQQSAQIMESGGRAARALLSIRDALKGVRGFRHP